MGGNFAKTGKYKTHQKPEKYPMKVVEIDHFLRGHEITLRKKTRTCVPSLIIDAPPVKAIRSTKSCMDLNKKTTENFSLPTVASQITLLNYDKEMEAIKKSMEDLDDTTKENEEDLKIMQMLENIAKDIEASEDPLYLEDLKGMLNSYKVDLTDFEPINEEETELKDKYFRIISGNMEEINNKILSLTHTPTAEEEIKKVLHNLKEPRLKMKTAESIEEFNEIKNCFADQLIELNNISCEDDKTMLYKNKAIEKIKHYKEIIHEKIYQLSTPSVNQHSVDSYNTIQEITVELNLLKKEIIDYFGTSTDDEYNNIVERLNSCHATLKRMDAKGDINIVVCKEQYEDNIERLKEIFDKIIVDNENNFRNDVEQMSKIERRKDRRRKSSVIQFVYKSNTEDVDNTKKLNTQISHLSDITDNTVEEQHDYINLTTVEVHNVEESNDDSVRDYLRSFSTDTTLSEVYVDAVEEIDVDVDDDYEDCINFAVGRSFVREPLEIKTYPVDMPENGFAAIFGGNSGSPEQEKFESLPFEEHNHGTESCNEDQMKYNDGNIESVNDKIDEQVLGGNYTHFEEQKEFLEQDGTSFIKNLIINQLFLEHERKYCAQEMMYDHEFLNNKNLETQSTANPSIVERSENHFNQEDENCINEDQDEVSLGNTLINDTMRHEDHNPGNNWIFYEGSCSSSEESSATNSESEESVVFDNSLGHRHTGLMGLQFKKVLRELKNVMSKKRNTNKNREIPESVLVTIPDPEENEKEQIEYTEDTQGNDKLKITDDTQVFSEGLHFVKELEGQEEHAYDSKRKDSDENTLMNTLDSLLCLGNYSFDNNQQKTTDYQKLVDDSDVILEEQNEFINNDGEQKKEEAGLQIAVRDDKEKIIIDALGVVSCMTDVYDDNQDQKEVGEESSSIINYSHQLDGKHEEYVDARIKYHEQESNKFENDSFVSNNSCDDNVEVRISELDESKLAQKELHYTESLAEDMLAGYDFKPQESKIDEGQQKNELMIEDGNLRLIEEDRTEISAKVFSETKEEQAEYEPSNGIADDNHSSSTIIHNSSQKSAIPESSDNNEDEDLAEHEDGFTELPQISRANNTQRGDIFSSKKKLKVVQECVDELKEQIDRFEGDKKDENYKTLYETLFDCMDILNLIKSSDIEIVNTKQEILNKILKCIRELEKKVKPKRKSFSNV